MKKIEEIRGFLWERHNNQSRPAKEADEYGVLLGFDSEGHLYKSTGYGNFQYGNEVRLATEEEIKAFIWEVFNYQNLIREYGRP